MSNDPTVQSISKEYISQATFLTIKNTFAKKYRDKKNIVIFSSLLEVVIFLTDQLLHFIRGKCTKMKKKVNHVSLEGGTICFVFIWADFLSFGD